MADTKMMDKIVKLLAMAEGTDNAAEAEAFTAKATELMFAHSIDEAMLAYAGTKSGDTIIAKDVTIEGYAKAKMSLLAGIATALNVKSIYTPNTKRSGWSTIKMTLIGWESDISNVEVLFASLVMQMTNEMERQAKQNKNVHGRAFKQAFIIGFANEVFRRLTVQRADAVKVAEDATPGAALAVVDRNKAVSNDFARRFPRTGKGTGPQASSYTGMAQGRAAGQRANIGQSEVSGGRRAIGR